jgi:hypothetical protein
MTDKKLTVTSAVNGVAVAGRCSRCHRPFEYPNGTANNAGQINRRLVTDFESHICPDANSIQSTPDDP